MKKTIFAMLMMGCSVMMFAQTTPTSPTPTTPPTTTPTKEPTTTPTTEPTTTPTTEPTTPPTTQPLTTEPMKTTEPVTPPADQMKTTTQPVNTTTDVNATTSNQVTANTTWAAGTSPYWGWNNYALWNMSMYPTTSANNSVAIDNGNLTSTSANTAFGTSVAALPFFVQNNFSKDYPTTANQQYSWSQYGDWFQTHYVVNGRLIHYYYNARGMGYSLALPVIQTYVPEDIIEKALMKYGANLYSVGTVKTPDGDGYQIRLIERGELKTEYLKEDGSTITTIWRVEEPIVESTTDANAPMDTPKSTELAPTTEPHMKTGDEKETKSIWKEDGEKTKIKSDDGKLKIKQKKIDD